jgi:hypothetical protein
VSLFGTDQRITSGPAVKRPHSKAEYMTAPERFADSQIPLTAEVLGANSFPLRRTRLLRADCLGLDVSGLSCGLLQLVTELVPLLVD